MLISKQLSLHLLLKLRRRMEVNNSSSSGGSGDRAFSARGVKEFAKSIWKLREQTFCRCCISMRRTWRAQCLGGVVGKHAVIYVLVDDEKREDWQNDVRSPIQSWNSLLTPIIHTSTSPNYLFLSHNHMHSHHHLRIICRKSDAHGRRILSMLMGSRPGGSYV